MRPAEVALLDQGEHRSAESDDTQHGSGVVDVHPGPANVLLAEHPEQDERDDDRDHIDGEDEAPAQVVDEDAAEERAGEERGAGPGRPLADRLGLGGIPERRHDDGQRARHQERASDALNCAHGDHEFGGARDRDQNGCHPEPDQPHPEHDDPAVDV